MRESRKLSHAFSLYLVVCNKRYTFRWAKTITLEVILTPKYLKDARGKVGSATARAPASMGRINYFPQLTLKQDRLAYLYRICRVACKEGLLCPTVSRQRPKVPLPRIIGPGTGGNLVSSLSTPNAGERSLFNFICVVGGWYKIQIHDPRSMMVWCKSKNLQDHGHITSN